MKNLLYALLLTMSIMSCQNDEGCTNILALNYSSEAEQDDGSCVFEAYMIFGMLDQTADQLNTMGIYSVSYYLDGVLVGTKSTSQSWYITDDTDCMDPNELTKVIDLGGSPSTTVYYEAKDSNGNLLDDNTITLDGGDCRTIYLDL